MDNQTKIISMKKEHLSNDNRIVLTLDAGGTNFNFSALRNGLQMTNPLNLPAYADNKEKCLKTIILGFKNLKDAIFPEIPNAISFAFPGPADYQNGIIGDIANFPGFKGGVALGPMLENEFNIPVIINNDGDLFAYGESQGGFLKYINNTLEEYGVNKRYHNLIGITLGTGFGAGIVINNEIYSGDNSSAGEIWLTRNYLYQDLIAEESVSIRAIQNTYNKLTNTNKYLTPRDIFEIAEGTLDGNKSAAITAFEQMGTVIGESLANALILIDAPVVIGGGVTGAADYIIPSILKQLKSSIKNGKGESFSRIIPEIFFINDTFQLPQFLENSDIYVDIPFSEKKVKYDKLKKIPIGMSRLGTSEAIWLGAYLAAIDFLDNRATSGKVRLLS